MQKMNSIDNYYQWDAKVRSAISDLEVMNPSDPDNIEYNNNRITQIEGILVDFDRSGLKDGLQLQENDPIQLLNRTGFLQDRIQAFRETLNYTYSILHEIFYRRGLEAMLAGNSQSARNWLMKSLDANRAFAPAQFQLANIDFSEGQSGAAAEKITDLFINMQPDPETQMLASELAKDIYEDFILQSQKLMNESDYLEALRVLDNVEEYCQDLYVIECTDDITKNRILSHNGYYQNILAASKAYLEENKLEEAEAYVDEALSYQQKNNVYITDNQEAENLKKEVKIAQYHQMIASGKESLIVEKYELALKQFEEAKTIEQNYSLESNDDLPNLLRQSAKPIILENVRLGLSYVEQNRLNNAQEMLKNAKALQNKYFTEVSDSKVSQQVLALQGEIFSQECQNAQEAYNTNLLEAKNMMEIFQYLEANRFLILALKEHEAMPDCGMDVTEAEAEKERIKPAVQYLQMKEEANELKDQAKYNLAIEKYSEASSFFEQNTIIDFGLQHLPLFNYLIESDNRFMKSGVAYYTKQNQLDNALKLLNELYARNYHQSYLKYEQRELGKKMAVRDYANGVRGKGKVLVQQYTNGSKWYKYFAKSYKKQFKSY
jgi:tetratricopeptide (TPR) repeat protein